MKNFKERAFPSKSLKIKFHFEPEVTLIFPVFMRYEVEAI